MIKYEHMQRDNAVFNHFLNCPANKNKPVSGFDGNPWGTQQEVMKHKHDGSTGEAADHEAQLNLALEKSISGCWAMNLQRYRSEKTNRQRINRKVTENSPEDCYSGVTVNLLLEDVLFLLLLRCWQTHRFLSLVIHHLLHHAAGLSIQVWQLHRKQDVKWSDEHLMVKF